MGTKGTWRLAIFSTIVILMVAFTTPGMARAAALHQPSAAAAQTISQFSTTEKVAVLTFDAGSDTGYAASILDTLKAKGVKATFGMTGVWASANLGLVRRMVSEGHRLMNHTWDHQSFTGASTHTTPLTSAQRASELKRVEDYIWYQVGVGLKPYFRAPYGDTDSTVLADVGANGYTYNIKWTIDTLSSVQPMTAQQITDRVLAYIKPGAIVLMHVGGASQDGPALPGMIDRLRAQGYSFRTVQDFLPQQQYFPQTGYTLKDRFLTYWQRNGGLPVFGYPISAQKVEQTAQGAFTVQYTERQRFELHPENNPPYHILLGLLGTQDARRRGLLGTAPFRPLPANTPSDANCTFIAATGHRLCYGFRAYWQSHGLDFGDPGTSFRESLMLFGYPISEEFRMTMADGHTYTVQYFERARFEWHPENQPPYDILLGLLGVDNRQ